MEGKTIKLQSKDGGKGLEINLYGKNIPSTLKELCDKYEDYEEPKEFIFIDDMGRCQTITENELTEKVVESMKEIGNYFETKEEAEKAVEWLKAFTILKQDTKGHKFKENERNYSVYYNSGRLMVKSTTSCLSDRLYFANYEDAEKSINKHRKEWLTYLGVEEEK